MGILAMLVVLSFIAFAFLRGALFFVKFRRQLIDVQSDFGKEYLFKYPTWHRYMKFATPILIFGFGINAIFAALGVVYVVVRFISDH